MTDSNHSTKKQKLADEKDFFYFRFVYTKKDYSYVVHTLISNRNNEKFCFVRSEKRQQKVSFSKLTKRTKKDKQFNLTAYKNLFNI